MSVAEHLVGVGSDLAEDGAGGGAVDAGEGLQEAALLGVGREGFVDVAAEAADALADGVMFGQQVVEQPALGLPPGQVQCVAEPVELSADVPAQRGENVLGVESADEAVENPPAVAAKDVAQHGPDADAAPVDDLLGLIADLAASGEELSAVAAQRAQVAELLVGDETGPSQPELAHACEPADVLDVGLSSAELLDVLGVEQLRLDACVGEGLPGGCASRRRSPPWRRLRLRGFRRRQPVAKVGRFELF